MSEKCKGRVWTGSRGWGSSQCSRAASCGPNNEYCKQHAREFDKSEPTIELWSVRSSPYKYEPPTRVMAREVTAHRFIDSKGRANNLTTEWDNHFHTRAEAFAFLLAIFEAKARRARAEAADFERFAEECRNASMKESA